MKYILLFFSINTFLFAQDSTQIQLQDVTVTANIQQTEIRKTARNVTVITAKDIEKSPVKTIDGILQYALNIDVRTRSPFGVQTDVSIRGGHYDQTLVLVDGVKMNDPQTGHHTFNLPFSVDMIEKIEILQGGASRVFGPSAFSGVINIITKKNLDNQLRLNIGGGQHGLYQLNAGGSLNTKIQNTVFSVEKIASDGYAQNTAFDRKNAYLKSIFNLGKTSTFSVQGGWLSNKFGASNFYHPKFYKQYEEISSQFLIGQFVHNFSNKFQSNLTYSYRKHNDMYDFDNYRTTKPSSVNYHQTDVNDIEWKNRWINSWGISSFGLEWRKEAVISNRLGEKLVSPKEIEGVYGQFYTNAKTRNNSSAYFEHLKKYEKLTLVVGTMYNINSQFGNDWFPGADVSYTLNSKNSIYASANRSLRFPTFTEMYLNSSTVVADPNIKPEVAWTYEIGTKRFANFSNYTISVFLRNMGSAIDKIKRPEKAIPTMENINGLKSYGFEAAYQLKIADFLANHSYFLQKINLNYAYLWANKKEEGFQSFYTLNYLRHKLSAGTSFYLTQHLSFDIWYTFKKRMGQYQWDANTAPQNYKAVHLIDARLQYSKNNFRAFVDCNNLLNYEYFEHGFVEQPRRWISTGISYVFL